MARFFDLDEANETIPELRTILETLRDERSQLIALRDEFARRTALETATRRRLGRAHRPTTPRPAPARAPPSAGGSASGCRA